MTIDATLSLRILSEANSRGSWHAGARRAKEQRAVVTLALRPRVLALGWDYDYPAQPAGVIVAGPYGHTVTLTRIAPRKLDGDNLQRALKAVRDGVADALGIDDGDARIEWRYEQRKREGCNPDDILHVSWAGYGVRIRIEARDE